MMEFQKSIRIFFLCFIAYITSFHIHDSKLLYKAQQKWISMKTPDYSNFKPTRLITPGKISPKRKVPLEIRYPEYAFSGKPPSDFSHRKPWIIPPTDPADIELMRIAGKYAREVLDAGIRAARIGVTTDEIDAVVHEETIKRDCYPSTLNYGGFPKSCCTSINEIICHGIPDSTKLQDGDIINIDVTVYYHGVHGDCSETVLIGQVAPQLKELVYTTYQAWQAAINICKPGVPYNKIGGVIEDTVSAKGYGIAKEFLGHGIGRRFHSTPHVFPHRNQGNNGVMAIGHTFTIEPIICLGSGEAIHWADDWTAATKDGLPTAQFEHTLLINATGVEMLTGKLPTSPKYFWEEEEKV